jgi:hypothetical protein
VVIDDGQDPEATSRCQLVRDKVHRPAVVEHLLYGAINMLTGPESASTCLWVHCALSSGGRLQKEFAAQRAAGHALLRKRFQRAIDEGDLPVEADANELAHLVLTINYGMTVQVSTGATRKDLEPRRPPKTGHMWPPQH